MRLPRPRRPLMTMGWICSVWFAAKVCVFPGPKAASVKEKMLFVEPARYRTPSSEDEGGATVLSLAGLAITAPELLVLSADASLCTTTSWLPSGLSGRLGRAWAVDGLRRAELRAGRVLLF